MRRFSSSMSCVGFAIPSFLRKTAPLIAAQDPPISSRQPPTMVARPCPLSVAVIAPGSRIENTMIGIRFSRASANAVASITFRSRCIASSWVSRSYRCRRRVLLRVGAVDAIHIGGLEHGVALQLGRAQDRSRVGREERVAGAARKHDDSVVCEMPNRARALVGLADLRHRERRHRARRCAGALERELQARAHSSRWRACRGCRRSRAGCRASTLRRRERCCRHRRRRQAKSRARARSPGHPRCVRVRPDRCRQRLSPATLRRRPSRSRGDTGSAMVDLSSDRRPRRPRMRNRCRPSRCLRQARSARSR